MSLSFCEIQPSLLQSPHPFILRNSTVPPSISTSVSSYPKLRRGLMKSATKFLLDFPTIRILVGQV
ncbi:hypothetical protein HanHA300_Chr00c0361g0750041 [Helianthus annuus]|nr:hypothetical protein HanIR_Chr17g0850451 [Helianthus annuus]KAJ0446054.1 hypothetical protein HanHA89_Chr17g0690121 [Helianthus annuus]KAJ0630274.1 hypothetical protein HanHA300_Chr00c0361g0750041 [Helianthus annuus]KAJ0631010.1 hypothetical protein HanLR1_Chr17g0649381 [Helianthus annuus]KAJ0634883.1 hypothetical protein HanOQP8_Chr17g0644851 [Helianthus annuus]